MGYQWWIDGIGADSGSYYRFGAETIGDGNGINANQGDTIFEETEFMGFRNVVSEFPEILDVLC